jgi:hypothetical protein
MKQIALAACLAATFVTAADAANRRVEKKLDTLDPMTRLEQVCAIETMTRVHKDKNPYSFTCRATADHMAVSSFSYKIGDPIPEEKWETYGLY